VLEVQGCNSNPVRIAIACLILSKPPDLLSCFSSVSVSPNPFSQHKPCPQAGN